MKKQKFVPKDLQSYPKTPGFYTISRGLYHTARELLNGVEQDQRHSPSALSSVILFTATIESYFNEMLTINLLANSGNKELIDGLRLGYYSNGKLTFRDKIKTIFIIYDKKQMGINTNSHVYKDLISLISLRNHIVHYVPDFENIYNYPNEFDYIIKRTKIKLLNADWTSTFSTVEIGNWAKATVRNTLIEFSKITGAHNPFTDDERFKSTRWAD